ncbi:hypothetical protein [Gordonia neofelifaecis]|uniref:Uncharacterized protein n=1 Tax=Gordonia neofelifaecis NRRL B-59395 TaxID=644548 RepID=F1YJN9_9ACTN|nr:hypothetical protein [Gordonia neofelifaecis]EGD54971.1 hypothetical protein SCNU_10586 [Gordonia neofelifaecis NRRL B-59395]
MAHTARLTSTARRAAVVAAAGAAAVSLAAIGAGTAHAAVGDNLDDSCLEFSKNGSSWSTDADSNINWLPGNIPSPGSDVENGKTSVRNVCATPAKFQVYAGHWSITGGGSAYLRADLGGAIGANHPLAGDPGLLIAEKTIAKDTPMTVTLRVGIPTGETKQGYTIQPNWSFALEEVAGGDNGGGNNSGGGSLDSVFGSLGTGSLDSASASKLVKVHSPSVTVR